ncbi:ATP-independent RNA helicase DbpA [Pedobacter cryoconitis]|uniref:ATP-independent RNA helicase DbpA n=1 Tax=Pedobacter cryoconitis TaxID=188932 RepID=A0A7W8YPV1_9SPHI|nr:DEAD/DEAH box helicase [Pedobacter cryoconitis]MBB5619589.1 ATP-independent RNA helicase DbpA [Pedobacter cryoconitis]MBB5647734.1 ATP-independent RNA helicase DbpA [Pedobacter cryoconitis]
MMVEKVLGNLKIDSLNEMQQAAIAATAKGKDVVLLAPTGSGKTLGFLLPVLKNLDAATKGVQALILVPSRELALQIEQVFKQMGTGFKVNCCYGGHPVKTERNNFEQPPAVLIGTPGRIAYHLRKENFDESSITTLVLDEFDKALEFGFQEDMAYIIGNMRSLKQRMLTSATQMEAIPDFTGLKSSVEINFLKDVKVAPDLKLKKVMTTAEDKLDTLFELICKIGNKTTLLFCNHRETVDRISDLLIDKDLAHDIFHGGMEQDERERALLKFRNGSIKILITTDLASRGLDIPEVEYIIHYQLPYTEDAFLHRNGRTARMNAKGTAYLMMTEEDKYPFLKGDIEIEKLKGNYQLPKDSQWQTLYIAAGKKDKVNKIDIVGLLLKKGGLEKDDVGLIEVKDQSSYVAVKRSMVNKVLSALANEKIKNKKVKIEVAM